MPEPSPSPEQAWSWADVQWGKLILLLIVVGFCIAAFIVPDKTPPPSQAFKTGYYEGYAAGGYPEDCYAGLARDQGITDPDRQDEWVAGCQAGIQDNHDGK